MLRVIISSILAVAAIFIGFYPHSEECRIISILGYKECIGWEFHIMLGTLLYILAVFVSQKINFNFISSYTSFDTSNKSKESQN